MPSIEPSGAWQRYTPAELDRQYDARASVPSFAAEYARYVDASAPLLTDPRRYEGIVYDSVSGQSLDLYLAGPQSPVFLWIHGGYWRALSRLDNAFAAAGLVERGISVAVLDYALAPAASLAEIVRQTRSAVEFLARSGSEYGLDVRRIHAGGSSAGGHLAGMLFAEGWHHSPRMGVILALSGLHDVEPLVFTPINSWMNLDVATARALSPIRHIPKHSQAHVLASVGGLETDEFRRQTLDYADAVRAAGNRVETIEMAAYNHFDIALSMRKSDGALTTALCAAIHRYHPDV